MKKEANGGGGLETPAVSVIMSVYNAEDTLRQAVESILNQTLSDFELIICDDASTDGTWAQLKALAERDGRIVLLQNPTNLKLGAALNRCLDLARGRYIARMDGDDWSAPERLARQREFLDSRPELALVGSRCRFFHRIPGDMSRDYWFVREPQPEDFLMTMPFIHPALMLRAESLRAIGGYVGDDWACRSEDYDMLMRLYASGGRGANLDEALYYFRLDEGTYRRRKYRYRVNEARVKWKGFSAMGLMPRGIPYALKPLVVGLIPHGLLDKLKKRYYKDR